MQVIEHLQNKVFLPHLLDLCVELFILQQLFENLRAPSVLISNIIHFKVRFLPKVAASFARA